VEHADDIEVAAGHARAAVDLMVTHQVPATPQNFTLWYTYASGRDPDLKRVIDDLIEAGKEFDDFQNAELFQKFFGFAREGATIQAASEKIDSSVKRVREFLSEATNGAHNFGETLENSLSELVDGDKDVVVEKVIQSVASETEKMLAYNRGLEEQLSSTSVEIEALRQNLEDIQREAMTDALTGIANRKYFDVTLRTEAMHSMEDGSSLCLMLLDIDFFKKFNDNYGHQTGDDVLKLVAHTMSANIKGRDTAARYGGEEFAVILPDTVLETASVVAEKIRTTIESKRFRKKQTGEELDTITISIGVAEFHPGESLTELIQRSDDALYQAKGTGRNRVVLESDLATTAAD
jgi:diguanylate cyclase|tara:strand:+ start:764 stop:1813 length:1050 start_codon:yes stop_codon:yes gene_type:complete